MKISRKLALKILKYLGEHPDFHFPFIVVCGEYLDEDGEFMKIEPDKRALIAKDKKYQTFELCEKSVHHRTRRWLDEQGRLKGDLTWSSLAFVIYLLNFSRTVLGLIPPAL